MHIKSIAVIYTVINGKKHFVDHASASTLHAGQKVVTYTQQADCAKEFESLQHAISFIPCIVNPYKRQLLAGMEHIDTDSKWRKQKEMEEALR